MQSALQEEFGEKKSKEIKLTKSRAGIRPNAYMPIHVAVCKHERFTVSLDPIGITIYKYFEQTI